MMKRSGWVAWMLGSSRDTWWMLGCGPGRDDDAVNVPCSRNGLMLAIVSSEDADGDSRMMGSLDRDGFDGFGVGIEGIVEAAAMAAGCEAGGWPGRCGRDFVCGVEAAAAAAAAAVAGLVVRSRVIKSSACFRTWEKSCCSLVSIFV